jgi:trimethylamine--corrinoid protein Co-methyltransferase
MSCVDLDTWELRQATLKEHGNSCRLADALDNLHMTIPYEFYMDMKGIPSRLLMLEGIASGLKNSTKVQITGSTDGSEVFTVEMAKTLGVDLIPEICSSPPLTLYGSVCDEVFAFVQAGIPIQPTSGSVFGGTAPATIAGATLTNNAELISLIVLAQLINPGVGIQAADFCFPMNMKTGAPFFGTVGVALHQVVFDQYWRWLGIPTCQATGGYSVNSKKIDFQNGYERSMLCLVAALAGDNRIALHGQVSQELAYSDLQAVLDDDIAGWIGRFIESIEVSNETLALGLIDEVGPIPGVFLNTKHTRDWWQKEQYIPKVADTLTYPEWKETGKKDALILAKERVEEILAIHKPTPLTPTQEADIGRILKEAREYYRKKGMISDEEWELYQEEVLKSPDYPFA